MGSILNFSSINFFPTCYSLTVQACLSSPDPGQVPDELKTSIITNRGSFIRMEAALRPGNAYRLEEFVEVGYKEHYG